MAALRRHYRQKERPEALVNLATALREAKRQIVLGKGLPAPRPYPNLARPGERWVKAGRYWIVYGDAPEPTILAVFYDTSDIPNRS